MTGSDLIVPVSFCIVPLLIELLLLIDAYSTFSNNVAEIKKIRHLLAAGSISSVFYFIEYVFSEFRYLEIRDLGMILNALLYVGNMLLVAAYSDLIYFKYQKQLRGKKINRLLFLSPMLALLVLEVANAFYPIFFDIDPKTFVYIETPLIIIVNTIPLFYILFSAINDIKETVKGNTRYNNLPISMYFSVNMIGIGLEALFPSVPAIPLFSALSVMIVYIRIIKRICYIDRLSGLYASSHLNAYINGLLESRTRSEFVIAGIMIDVNHFKAINDTYGHVVGDKAISAMGSVLKKATKKHGICFRYGGDEFILKVLDTGVIQDIMAGVDQAVSAFNVQTTELFRLSVSQGYAVYDIGRDSVITFIERMDSLMYKNKKAPSRAATGDTLVGDASASK